MRKRIGCQFQDPGGESALRRATKNNPRKYPCPTCGRKNMLTARDVKLGYQCDICADECSMGNGTWKFKDDVFYLVDDEEAVEA